MFWCNEEKMSSFVFEKSGEVKWGVLKNGRQFLLPMVLSLREKKGNNKRSENSAPGAGDVREKPGHIAAAECRHSPMVDGQAVLVGRLTVGLPREWRKHLRDRADVDRREARSEGRCSRLLGFLVIFESSIHQTCARPERPRHSVVPEALPYVLAVPVAVVLVLTRISRKISAGATIPGNTIFPDRLEAARQIGASETKSAGAKTIKIWCVEHRQAATREHGFGYARICAGCP